MVGIYIYIHLPDGLMRRLHGRLTLVQHRQWPSPTDRGRIILELVVGDLVFICPDDFEGIAELDLLLRYMQMGSSGMVHRVVYWSNGRLMCVSMTECTHYGRYMQCNGD